MAHDAKDCKHGTILQYQVDGVLAYRGFHMSKEELNAHGLGFIGANYPGGPVVFLLSSNPDVPNGQIKRFHQERLGDSVGGPALMVLKKAIGSTNYFRNDDIVLSKFRLTECADMYPAHIDCGKLIHSATDTEIERLSLCKIKLDYTENCERPHWALKTKQQIQSGIPPAADASSPVTG